MSSDAYAAKRALRAEIRERRRTATAAERERDALGHTERLVELVRSSGADTLAAYLSTEHEPSTRGFLAWAQTAGLRVLLPISREDGLLDWAAYDGGSEAHDPPGMPPPTSGLLGPAAVNDVDLLIVPASAVGSRGMRMGWGRGYYDRTLGSMAARPPVYAVVFDHEVVDDVPADAHDVPVDGVVTPTRIIHVST